MDKLTKYQNLIKTILLEDAKIPPGHGDIEAFVVFDDERHSYQLMYIGWDRQRRMHSAILHLRLRGGKIWIEWDGTQEGVATKLMAAGVPKEEIVLAFYPERKRRYTEFAVS